MKPGSVFIVSAPSGCGKTTILNQVLSSIPNISFSVSHTTRAPRPGEIDGRDYHFTDRETFHRMRDEEEFLEWAEVHGNLYGTSLETVKNQVTFGSDIILDIDIQGARQIRTVKDIDAIAIFIVPPSLAELERRLTSRNTDSSNTISLRLENSLREMADLELYDHVIVNDNLDEAVEMVSAIVLSNRSKSLRGRDGLPLTDLCLNRS